MKHSLSVPPIVAHCKKNNIKVFNSIDEENVFLNFYRQCYDLSKIKNNPHSYYFVINETRLPNYILKITSLGLFGIEVGLSCFNFDKGDIFIDPYYLNMHASSFIKFKNELFKMRSGVFEELNQYFHAEYTREL